MTNERPNEFEPTVWFPPGETLQETLEAVGMTQAELAKRTGLTTKHISQIANGKAAISVGTALQFEIVLGIPCHIWLGLEQYYRAFLARREEDRAIKDRIGEYREWLRQFPISDMAELGWIRRVSSAVDKAKELLQYFRIASLDQWDEGQIVGYGCRLRSSDVTGKRIGALLAWLWKGRLAGMETDCASYDQDTFRQVLSDIRGEVPSFRDGLPERMQSLCASAGVALIFVHELPRMGAYGATCWITAEKALIQMCLRGKRDDQFWFTFFHEAGHILRHGKTDCFVEEDEMADADEKERAANSLAADFLIDPTAWRGFARDFFWDNLSAHNYEQGKIRIVAFARQCRVSPGIVVGRLQREKRVEHKHFNDLKIRLGWTHG